MAATRVDDLVYGGPLFATAGVGLLLLIVGSVALGRAVATSGVAPRWSTRTFVVASAVFPLAGLPGLVLQPIAGFALAAASAAIARALTASAAASEVGGVAPGGAPSPAA